MEFQGGSISPDDWSGMLEVAQAAGVRTVLEFGSGKSTQCWVENGFQVTSFETNPKWISRVREDCPDARVVYWDNRIRPPELENGRFDLAFVDGQGPRDLQMDIAKDCADLVLVHDGQRDAKNIERYLSGWEELPIRGRCRYFRRRGNRYAALTSATSNYMHYLKALLMSMHRLGMRLDMHVVCVDVPDEELNRLENFNWSFRLCLKRHRYEDYPDYSEMRKAFTPKKARYDALRSMCGSDYEALVLLDADMMVVGDFTPQLQLVAGTDLILGVNEQFKWPLGLYSIDGERIEGPRMFWMVCNAPLFLSPSKNGDLLEKMCYTARHLLDQKGRVPSDLFTMNVAIWLAQAYYRVLRLPSHSWTGTHEGYCSLLTRVSKRDGEFGPEAGKFYTATQEPVYIIHGRWDKEGSEGFYLRELEKRYEEFDLSEKSRETQRSRVAGTFRQIKELYKSLIEEANRAGL